MKKLVSIFLCLTLILPNTSYFYANQIAETAQTQEDENEVYYIPLRNVFETNDGKIELSKDGNIIVKKDNDTYEYSTKDNTIKKNEAIKKLEYPLKNIDGRIYIHYDDINFLYEKKDDSFKNAKKEAVAYAYKALKTFDVPGLTVSFVDAKTDYVWEQGFGYKDVENKELVTPDTLFGVASISKSFTALGVLKLVEEGKISLDDKVVDIFPEFSVKENPVYGGNSDDITVRMLLSHYSGITDDMYDNCLSTKSFNKDYMNNLIGNLKNEHMLSVSGTRLTYSNVAYGVLGNIVGKFSGKENIYDGFVNEMTADIFNPINLEKTAFGIVENKDMAKSYMVASMPKQAPIYMSNIAAGGLFSNAKDMSKFMKLILNKGTYEGKEVFKPSTIDLFLTEVPLIDNINGKLNPGLGTYETAFDGMSFKGHGGDLPYFHSNYALSMETGLGAFVSGNSATSISASGAISLILLSEAVKESGRTPKSFVAKDIKNVEKKAIEEYVGYYYNFGNLKLEDNGDIYFDTLDLKFTKTDNGTYENELIGEIEFKTIDGIDCIISLMMDMVSSQKVTISKATEGFKSLAGKYKPVLKDGDHSLVDSLDLVINDNGDAFMSMSALNMGQLIKSDFGIEIVNDNKFVILGTTRMMSSVVEAEKTGEGNFIKYMGVQYKQVTE